MDISIIIPTYNRASLLMRALESVVSQGGYTEIIVVDDGGSDDTEERVKKFNISDRINYVRQEKNKGVNAARNLGVSLARGTWVAFLDDDDEFVKGALKNIATCLVGVPKTINVVYFNSIIDNGSKKVSGGFQFAGDQREYDPTYEETMTKFNLNGDCKPIFRKSLFENFLYTFPETVNGYESYTMNLIARDNKGIRYVRDVSTLVHFDMTHSHISHTAPRKNPQPLLDLHIKQLEEHREFYKKNPKQLEEKYLTMVKLAIRASNIKALVLYSVRFLLSKIRA
jgi:glycosyltransferase involved in cell wall biosynthesis